MKAARGQKDLPHHLHTLKLLEVVCWCFKDFIFPGFCKCVFYIRVFGEQSFRKGVEKMLGECGGDGMIFRDLLPGKSNGIDMISLGEHPRTVHHFLSDHFQ